MSRLSIAERKFLRRLRDRAHPNAQATKRDIFIFRLIRDGYIEVNLTQQALRELGEKQ